MFGRIKRAAKRFDRWLFPPLSELNIKKTIKLNGRTLTPGTEEYDKHDKEFDKFLKDMEKIFNGFE